MVDRNVNKANGTVESVQHGVSDRGSEESSGGSFLKLNAASNAPFDADLNGEHADGKTEQGGTDVTPHTDNRIFPDGMDFFEALATCEDLECITHVHTELELPSGTHPFPAFLILG